jgi:CRISPR-associated protein Cas1
MRLVVTKRGGYLQVEGETLIYRTEEGARKQISLRDLRQLVIATSIKLSSDVVSRCGSYGIDMVFLDNWEEPVAIMHPSAWSTGAATKRNQAFLMNDPEHIFKWSAEIVKRKIAHQRLLSTEQRIKRVNNPQELLGIEGAAAAVYWQGFNHLLPDELVFQARSRRPATDVVNASLNYGYAILAGVAARSLRLAGCLPELGFFHKDRVGRLSLALDLVEIFRAPLIDQAVLTLARRRQLKVQHGILAIGGGIILNDDIRPILSKTFGDKLAEPSSTGRRKNLEGAVVETAYQWAAAVREQSVSDMWRWRP